MEYSTQELLQYAVAGIIVLITAMMSVARQILKGRTSAFLWIIMEFLTAILLGFLAFDLYPILCELHYWPEFASLNVTVCLAAHSGGRLFQEFEDGIRKRYFRVFSRRSHT